MVASVIVRQKVYDPVQRILHWWISTTVMGLVALGWLEKLLEVGMLRSSMTGIHIVLGFALAAGFAARMVWGVIGPKNAQLNAFWQPVVWKQMIGHIRKSTHSKFGHNSIASIAYLAFYMMVACGVVTGMLLAGMRYDQGFFAKAFFDDLSWYELSLNIHNIVLYGVTLFVVFHILGMILHERKIGVPVAQAMISGYQYRRIKEGGES